MHFHLAQGHQHRDAVPRCAVSGSGKDLGLQDVCSRCCYEPGAPWTTCCPVPSLSSPSPALPPSPLAQPLLPRSARCPSPMVRVHNHKGKTPSDKPSPGGRRRWGAEPKSAQRSRAAHGPRARPDVMEDLGKLGLAEPVLHPAWHGVVPLVGWGFCGEDSDGAAFPALPAPSQGHMGPKQALGQKWRALTGRKRAVAATRPRQHGRAEQPAGQRLVPGRWESPHPGAAEMGLGSSCAGGSPPFPDVRAARCRGMAKVLKEKALCPPMGSAALGAQKAPRFSSPVPGLVLGLI